MRPSGTCRGGADRSLTDALTKPVIVPLMAIAGGILGIMGALMREIRSFSYLLAFIVAPMTEEALKPTGLYIALMIWPQVLKGKLYTALLAALSGLTFALIENIFYLKIHS